MNTLTWHGHSAFAITSQSQSILVDPWFDGNPSAKAAAAAIAETVVEIEVEVPPAATARTGRLQGQRVAWAWGYGGQFALLVPALGLVVATAATSPHPSALRAQTDAVMALVDRMVAAVQRL